MFIENGIKTINIPVIISGSKVRYFYEGSLPEIDDDTIGDLIISEFNVKDKNFVELCQMEREEEIINKDSILMVAVDSRKVPEDKEEFCKEIETNESTSYSFVEIKLLESLKLQYRGSKKANLLNVRCKIPSIETDAESINSAYTLISEMFEPSRRSHTGNVFAKCYYKDTDNKWYPLDKKRQEIEGEFDDNLFLDYKVYTLNEENFKEKGVGDSSLLLIGYLYENKVINGAKIKKLYNHNNKYVKIINDLLDKEIIYEVKSE